MAGPNFVLDKGFLAGGAIGKFRGVGLTSKDTVAQASTAGQQVIGFGQDEITADDATAGRVTDVRVLGISRAIAGAAITLGARLMVNATGQVVPFAAPGVGVTNWVVGLATTPAGAAGEHVDVLLVHGVSQTG